MNLCDILIHSLCHLFISSVFLSRKLLSILLKYNCRSGQVVVFKKNLLQNLFADDDDHRKITIVINISLFDNCKFYWFVSFQNSLLWIYVIWKTTKAYYDIGWTAKERVHVLVIVIGIYLVLCGKSKDKDW